LERIATFVAEAFGLQLDSGGQRKVQEWLHLEQYSVHGSGNASRQEAVMGKGDRRTKKGKIYRASFGNTRPKKSKKTVKKPQQ
jgi:30S ribosomal protein S31